jgi:hypothetical protein
MPRRCPKEYLLKNQQKDVVHANTRIYKISHLDSRLLENDGLLAVFKNRAALQEYSPCKACTTSKMQ